MAAAGVKDIEAKLPTKDEARRIAVNIAKLPGAFAQALSLGL